MRYGNLVWKIRSSKKLTLQEMEVKTGVSKTAINDIENGKKSPRLDTLQLIANGLDVNVIDLIDCT